MAGEGGHLFPRGTKAQSRGKNWRGQPGGEEKSLRQGLKATGEERTPGEKRAAKREGPHR